MTVNGVLHFQEPKPFIEELRSGSAKDLQKIFDCAITALNKENEEITKRNEVKPWYYHFINPLLRLISCGSLTLLEPIKSLDLLHQHIEKIKNAILQMPEIEQTWREDYPRIAREFKAATTLQKRWRARLRNKLKDQKQTYESWRANVLLQKNIDPLDLSEKFRDIYQPSHYTFTHGQSLYNTVVTAAMDSLARVFKRGNTHPLFINFRIPGTIPHSDSVIKFFEENPSINDSKPIISSQILSVDAYHRSECSAESARYFYKSNANITCTIPPDPILALFHDQKLASSYANRITIIAREFSIKHIHGSLYSIVIPKKIQDNPQTQVAYAAYAYGSKHPDQSKEYLERHQQNKSSNYTQFRIVLSSLAKQPGVRVFRKNNVSQAENEAMLQKVNAQTELYYAYSILANLKAPITDQQYKEVYRILIYYHEDIETDLLDYLKSICSPYISKEHLDILMNIKNGVSTVDCTIPNKTIMDNFKKRIDSIPHSNTCRSNAPFGSIFWVKADNSMVCPFEPSAEKSVKEKMESLYSLLHAYYFLYTRTEPLTKKQKELVAKYFERHKDNIDPESIKEILAHSPAFTNSEEAEWLRGYLPKDT